jgi:hypothetical protein
MPAPLPGHPDGGPSFSLWQQVQAQYDGTYCSGVFLRAQSSITTWSPDGRYLLTGIYLQGRLIPPGAPAGGTESGNCIPASQEATAPGAPSTLAALPLHDAGLRAALAADLTQPDPSRIQLNHTWEAQGRRLAVLAVPQFAPATINVYDTASGQLRQQLTVTPFDPHYDPSAPTFAVRWSPNGTRLLVFDAHSLTMLTGAEAGA